MNCPAGVFTEKNGKSGVHCKIEARFLAFRENPRTVLHRCTPEGGYRECPTWIADKEGDPAVAAAQGRPRTTTCVGCGGTGIEKVQKQTRSGLIFTDEIPCDACAGSGREILVRTRAEDMISVRP